jgi:hypothetical protein
MIETIIRLDAPLEAHQGSAPAGAREAVRFWMMAALANRVAAEQKWRERTMATL